MDNLLAPYNLLFLIPLIIGVLMAVGSAVGIADAPHGIDIDGDGHPDIFVDGSSGHHSEVKALSFLGFGKAPILLVLMVMCLLFGGVGVICNLVSKDPGSTKAVLFAVFCATLITVTGTGVFARIIAKLLPTMETTSATKQDLLGCTASLIIDSDPNGGIAMVRNAGDVYQVQVRSEALIPKGSQVIITDFNEATGNYDVCLDDSTK